MSFNTDLLATLWRTLPAGAALSGLHDIGPVAEALLASWAQSRGQVDKLLESAESRAPKKGAVTHRTAVRRLTEAYRAERLVLVLGAGTSAEYGLPDWNTLLQKLLISTVGARVEADHDAAWVLARLYTAAFAPNPLIAARYLSTHFASSSSNELAFEEAIRTVLYSELKPHFESDLVREIRQLCVAAGKNTPSLDSIVTYNYDDILETALSSLDVHIPHRAIHDVGMNPKVGEVPIYHVHGYLPRTGKLTAAHQVALSDERYHSQYTNIYGWSNLIQLNKFKDAVCLFMGVSMTDPNLRRLLDIASVQRGGGRAPHYMVRRRYPVENVTDSLKSILDSRTDLLADKRIAELKFDETVEKLKHLAEAFEQDDALSLGVSTIWVDEYADIPTILAEVRALKGG